MPKVLFIADHVQTIELAARFQKAALECGDEIIALSSRVSAVLVGRKYGVDARLVKRRRLAPHVPLNYSDLNYEVQSGYLTPNDGRRLVESLVAEAASIIDQAPEEWGLVMAWNGALASSQAAEAIAKAYGIPIVFMEIVNVPGRMVFDPEGSNSDASVARRPELLEPFAVTDEQYEVWAKSYVAEKRRSVPIPQAKRFRQPNFWFLLDLIGPLFGGAPAFSVGPLNRAINIFRRWRNEPKVMARSTPELPDRPFIFLPLQVSSDTNLVVRSKIGNLEAIRIGIEESRRSSAALVIRMHPAERSGSFFGEMDEFLGSCNDDVILTTAPTIDCILKSISVITINSTVAFEAIMLDRAATVLAPALYSRWDKKQMAAYVVNYTIDFDMYSKEPATRDQWRLIRERAKVLN